MKWIETTCFLVYSGCLALYDLKSGRIPLVLILAGGASGLLFRLAQWQGGEILGKEILLSYGPGLLWGLLLLLLVKPSRGSVGAGDGLCFLSFALWRDYGWLFSLLFSSLLLLALFGLLQMLKKKRDLKSSLPLLPFVWVCAAGMTVFDCITGALP